MPVYQIIHRETQHPLVTRPAYERDLSPVYIRAGSASAALNYLESRIFLYDREAVRGFSARKVAWFHWLGLWVVGHRARRYSRYSDLHQQHTEHITEVKAALKDK